MNSNLFDWDGYTTKNISIICFFLVWPKITPTSFLKIHPVYYYGFDAEQKVHKNNIILLFVDIQVQKVTKPLPFKKLPPLSDFFL